jgi:filamentous hemagglutinin
LLQKWFGKSFSKGQAKIALKSAQKAYKGSTRVGHALAKHAGRKPEIWGKMTGSMKTWNDKAMKHMREIIRGPGEFTKVKTDKGITFIEKRLSDGRGIRLNQDYSFKGFID